MSLVAAASTKRDPFRRKEGAAQTGFLHTNVNTNFFTRPSESPWLDRVCFFLGHHLCCNMDPLAGLDDSSSDDDAASQTTEDDPQIPENHEPPALPAHPAPAPVHPSNGHSTLPSGAAVPPPPATSGRAKPHYELRHTMRGHTKSLSAVKFSPDGTILASCGIYHNPLKLLFPGVHVHFD